MSGCVDAGFHKVLVRYPNPVLVVDTVDECFSKVSVVEERLKWEIIFSSFDGCKSTGGIIRVLLMPDVCGVEELVLNRFVAWVGVEVA